MLDPRFLLRGGHHGRGVKQIVQVPAPAVGNDWAVTVPGGEQWHIECGCFLLSTSAAVANRTVDIWIATSDLTVWTSASAVVQAASLVEFYGFSKDGIAGQGIAGTRRNQIGIPDLLLPPGTVFKTATFGVDVGDQFSLIALYVSKYYETDAELTAHAQDYERDTLAMLQQAGIVAPGA